jgi:hypothetical protein
LREIYATRHSQHSTLRVAAETSTRANMMWFAMIDPDEVERLRDEIDTLSPDDLAHRAMNDFALHLPMPQALMLRRRTLLGETVADLETDEHERAVEALRDFCFHEELGHLVARDDG